MSSEIERVWWEDDELHTVEDGKHFIHKGAQVVKEEADVGETHLTLSTQVFFASREECGVLEVPHG